MRKDSFSNAQGTIEYLVIMAVVVVIGLLVVGMASSFLDSSSGVSSGIGSLNSLTGPISISETVVDSSGDGYSVFTNNSGETLTVTRITLGGVDNDYGETVAPGNTVIFDLENLVSGCTCSVPGETKTCVAIIYYTSVNGITKSVSKSVTVDCVGDASTGGDVVIPTLPDMTIYLSDCNTDMSVSGNYVLQNDVSGIDSNCFVITADDVNLNGNGKTISFANNGTAEFNLSSSSSESDYTDGVGVGDFDGDGDLDYIVGNTAMLGQVNRVYLNGGSGVFSLGSSSSEVEYTRSLGVGDFDGDGDLDYIAGTYLGVNRVYLNDGSGVFSLGSSSSESEETYSIGVGDFDGDGDLDYIVGNDSVANRVYLNDGSGVFSLGSSSSESDYTRELGVGDFDGDGDLDYIALNSRIGQVNRVYLNVSDASTDNNYYTGVSANGVSNLNISNLNVNGFSVGISLDSVSDVNVSGCDFNNASFSALRFSNSTSSENVFEDNVFWGSVYGLELRSSTNATFNRNSFCSKESAKNSGSPRLDLFCYNDSSLGGSDNNASLNMGCAGFSWGSCQ